jgi:hypothetical protein
MLKIRCLERREGKCQHNYFTGIPGDLPEELKLSFAICNDCAQGSMVEAELKGNPPKPLRGEGSRDLDCPRYDDCLDTAVANDWQSFQCDECPFYTGKSKVVPIKKENERICEDCGEEKTLSPHCPYCAKCMALRGNAARKKAKAKPQKKSLSLCEATISVGFDNHVEILEEVKRLAEEELRPVEMQILFMCKKYLETRPSDS